MSCGKKGIGRSVKYIIIAMIHTERFIQIVLLLDVSASMTNHFQELVNHILDLLDDQLSYSHKNRLLVYQTN